MTKDGVTNVDICFAACTSFSHLRPVCRHLLLDLLEVLSGERLPQGKKGFNTFQCRSNIENTVTFLKSRSLKLINIHVADITEGNLSIVLGLIWTVIFHFRR
ncbi:nesprin-2-like [Cuculus canorus]|uniref:nesprin-2-like n=1 Tax=Cuculus canorus TaxID=55661 RepID=UPI0023AAE9C0|nr:nesprin-2-like [Cuculus canorus]